MLITAVSLIAVIVPVARRREDISTGGHGFLEVLVLFVRDAIARPALHERAYKFLPLLVTLFVFVLGMCLIGLTPLVAITTWLGAHVPFMSGRPIGVTPTSVLTICAALAAIALGSIVIAGLKAGAVRYNRERNRPMWLCWLLSPLIWVKGLAPGIPGVMGVIMLVPLAFLELVGVVAKCFALMIRLFANMMAGHAMLAVLMVFIIRGLHSLVERGASDVLYVAPAVIVASAILCLMETAIALLQAFIFTVLTAVFLGLYAEPAH